MVVVPRGTGKLSEPVVSVNAALETPTQNGAHLLIFLMVSFEEQKFYVRSSSVYRFCLLWLVFFVS